MPRLSAIGFAPAATFFMPPLTIARASTVAVVVPSPATSLVFVATSLVSCAPMFSHGSSSSISLAIVTPSLVIVGAPHFLSSTTFCPLGPSVIATASASLSTPASRPRRASSPNFSSFEATGVLPFSWLSSRRCDRARLAGPPQIRWLLPDDREDVASREDLELGTVGVLPLRAAVLRVDHHVADGHIDRDAGIPVLVELAGAHSDDGADDRFLLRGVGDHQPGRRGLLGLAGLHDDPVLERLELEVLRHACLLPRACRGGLALTPPEC